MKWLVLMAAVVVCNVAIAADSSKIVFQGTPRNLVFCEGDDVRLSLREGGLQVECADSRKTPITILGSHSMVGNMYFDCRGWPATAMDIQASVTEVKGTMTVDCGTGIRVNDNALITGDGVNKPTIKSK